VPVVSAHFRSLSQIDPSGVLPLAYGAQCDELYGQAHQSNISRRKFCHLVRSTTIEFITLSVHLSKTKWTSNND